MKTKHDLFLTRAENGTYHLWERPPDKARNSWRGDHYWGGSHWLESFICAGMVKKYFGLKRHMRCGSKAIIKATIEIEIKE